MTTLAPSEAQAPAPLDSSRMLGGAAAIAIALVVGIGGFVAGITWAPDATNRLRDDAFYEFVWAANVARGAGPVVSDGVTTSGVQLLWSLLLVPFAWLLPLSALPLVVPWLGMAIHVVTAGLWYRSVADRVAGICVAALWLGHPLLVRECQNGQETALACLMASVLWWQRRAGERRHVLCAVLAVLARSDLFALVVAMSLWRHGVRTPKVALAPAVAIAVHLAANVALGGGIWPDSALPMAWLWHANFAATEPTSSEWLMRAWWFFRPVVLGGPFALASAFGIGFVVFLLVRPWWPAALRALPALLVGIASTLGVRDLLVAGWTALLLAIMPASRSRRIPRSIAAVFFGLAAIVLLHWGLRWYPRDYYAAPLVVAAMATLARYGRGRLLLVIFALAQGFDRERVQPEPLAGQAAMQQAGTWLSSALPAGERVGCFNSGLVTFHADVLAPPERRVGVVNLDGVVDSRSFAALQRRELAAWLDAQHVRFVLDNPLQFGMDPRVDHANGRWFAADFAPERDLVEVARFVAPVAGGRGDGEQGDGGMRLYWRSGRGTPPPSATTARDLGMGADGARHALIPLARGQRLLAATGDASPCLVVAADAATTVWLRLPGPASAAHTLWLEGVEAPVLRLPPL